MSDNARELIKKRKQERRLLSEKTKLDLENNGGMPARSIGTHLALIHDDGDPLRVRGEWGTKYNDEDLEEEPLPLPKPKTEEELEIEEKLKVVRKSATLHRDVDKMMQFNYKLSDWDEEAEEKRKAVEARKIADMRKREELESTRLKRVKLSFLLGIIFHV